MNDAMLHCGCRPIYRDGPDIDLDIMNCRFSEAIRLLREFIEETESGPPSLGLREKTVTFLGGGEK